MLRRQSVNFFYIVEFWFFQMMWRFETSLADSLKPNYPMLSRAVSADGLGRKKFALILNEIWLIHLKWTNPYLFFARPHFYLRYCHELMALRDIYGFSIPESQTVRELKKIVSRNIIDLGAGKGYWAWFLSRNGFDVISMDDFSWEHTQDRKSFHFTVQQGCAVDAARFPDRTLFLSWPPYESSFAVDALRAYSNAGGQCFVFVADINCCGDESLREELYSNWNLIAEFPAPQVSGPYFSEGVFVYRKLPGRF